MTDDRRRFVFWHDGSEHRLHQACLIMQLVLHDDTAFNSGAIFQVLLVSKSMAACDQNNAGWRSDCKAKIQTQQQHGQTCRLA